ncbi:MAG: hypothetical protein VB120_07740 [Lachnospiraceae bacterium]|nr:hypothetical protein [Lachnospiraceae bacterium]
MNRKNNILLGVMLLILGIYSIAAKFFNINHKMLPVILLGFAFVLLYFKKEKMWALFIGFVIILKELCNLLNSLSGTPIIGSKLFWGVFFLLPGIFLLYKYFKTRKTKYLVPGSFAAWTGIFILSSFIECFSCMSGGLFFVCLGLTFLTAYVASGMKIGILYIIVSIIMFIIGTFLMTGIKPVSAIASSGTYISSVILIVVSIIILVKSIKSKD